MRERARGAVLRMVLAVAGLLSGCAATSAVGAEDGLALRLAATLASPALQGARISALVVEAETGGTLFARDADLPLVPASNLKVLTAIAALATWGPAHRFPTAILAPAPIDAEGGVATLYVRGGGDPALTSEQWWRLAADLRLLGLRRVRGDLVMDDTLFDDERWHPSWGDVTARAYHAPVGALMANYGAFRVTVAPGPPGAPARVRVDPPVAYLELRGQVRTRVAGAPAVQIRRWPAADTERIEVRGSIPADSPPQEYWRSVANPTRYAAAVLRMQLQANGIAVDGGVRRAPAPDDAELLLEFQGFPLAEVARLFLKHSNNVIAEALVKHLGLAAGAGAGAGEADGVGSWARGVAAERRALERLGLDLAGLRVVDGSGLSRENRVPARLLVSALRRAQRSFDFGPELVSAVPIAGLDGTLEERAESASGRLRAKTGLLTGVSGLCGYARSGADGQRVFAVLANGYANGDRAAMDALDAFAEALIR